MVLLWTQPARQPEEESPLETTPPTNIRTRATSEATPLPDYAPVIKRTIVFGIVAMTLSSLICWGIVRELYGDQLAGYAGHHIRFGPNAT